MSAPTTSRNHTGQTDILAHSGHTGQPGNGGHAVASMESEGAPEGSAFVPVEDEARYIATYEALELARRARKEQPDGR